MEKFQYKDVEVLYFTDLVDEYMKNNLRELFWNNFTSISREGINLNYKDENMFKRRDRT